MQVVKKKHRTRILEFFIDVARECFNIGNFNSMMAIICEYKLGCPPPLLAHGPTPSPLLPTVCSCSWHEPQSGGAAEENVVQGQDGQV